MTMRLWTKKSKEPTDVILTKIEFKTGSLPCETAFRAFTFVSKCILVVKKPSKCILVVKMLVNPQKAIFHGKLLYLKLILVNTILVVTFDFYINQHIHQKFS